MILSSGSEYRNQHICVDLAPYAFKLIQLRDSRLPIMNENAALAI